MSCTTSKSRDPSASRTAAVSVRSARRRSTPTGSSAGVLPRFSTLTRWPCFASSRTSASPLNWVPPITRTSMAASALQDGARVLRELLGRLRIAADVRHRHRDADAALAGRPRRHRAQPALEVAEALDGDARPAVDAHPRPVRDVGDRVLAGQPLALPEAPVEHLEEAARLVLVAVDRRLDLLREVAVEDVGLPHHRPDAAHLEHEPLDRARAALAVLRQQAPGLLGQVDQDRAGLEDREIALVPVDGGGNPPVRVDGEEPGLLLLELGQVDRVHLVGEAELLEGDRGFPAVRRRRGVENDHGGVLRGRWRGRQYATPGARAFSSTARAGAGW